MADFTWTGGGSGTSWGDPDDWTTGNDDDEGMVPGAGDIATFSDDATITDSGTAADIYVDASLSVDGGDVSAVDNFLVSDSLSVDSGSIGAGDLAVSGSADFDDASASIDEFVSVDDGASITFDDSTLDAPSLTLNGSGEFDDSQLEISQFVSVDDSGSLSLKGDSTLDTQSLTLNGTGEFDDSQLEISQFVSVDDNGSISLKGDSTLDAPSLTLNGSGDFDDSTADITQFVTVDDNGSLTLEQGSSLNADDMVVNGTVEVDDGVLTTTQSINVSDDGSIKLEGSSSSLDDSGSGGGAVGDGSQGSLTIEDGASASFKNTDPTSGALGVGVFSGDGTVTVEGAGSTLTTSGGGLVDGQFDGVGDVTIEDGATASITADDGFGALSVGYLGNGDGTFTVEGNGSSLMASGGDSVVGSDDSTGEFTIEDGATAEVIASSGDESALTVGGASGEGTLTVTGAGSSLTTSVGGLTIGYDDGTGYLYVESGGAVSSSESNPEDDSALEIGDDGMGTAIVEGGGSTLTTTNGNAAVGIAGGNGSLTIEDSGAADFTSDPSIYAMWIGYQGLGTGLVTVEGQGATLTTTGGGIGVGFDATGALDIESGANVSLTTPSADDSLDIGGALGNGAVKVDGSGSSLDVTGAVAVGLGGDGVLTILDGGSFTSSYGDGASVDIGVDDSGGDGTMTVGGASTIVALDQGQGIIVGDAGTGLLQVDDGASLGAESTDPDSSWAVNLGNQTTGDGTVDVDGADSLMLVGDGGMVVGNEGDGHVTVSDGGELDIEDSTYGLTIASEEDSTGDIVVTGDASSLQSAGMVWVGAGGIGSLTIDDGATFQSTYSDGPSVDLGVNEDSYGTMTVSNSGTDVTLDQGLGIVVGDGGMGALEVDDGATFNVSSADPDAEYALILGGDTTGDGTLTLTGTDSTLTVGGGGMSVGDVGDGHADIEDGATLNVTDTTYGLVVGGGDDATGDVAVSGQSSLLDATGPVSIGLSGEGSLTVDDGATFRVEGEGFVNIAANKGSDGTLTLQDDDTTFDYEGELTVGYSGDGKFVIEDGASWESQDNIIAANDDDSSGAITITGKESALTVGRDLTLGEEGDATLDVDDGASLTVRGNATEAEDDDAANASTISGAGTTVTYNGDDVIASSGTADDTISDGASATVSGGGDVTLGEKDSGDGALTITGDDSSFDAGSGTLTVGDEGAGEIDIEDGGSLSSSGAISIGDQDGSTGTIKVDGDNSSVDQADVTVGGQGAGSITISNGGSFEANNLTLGEQDGGDGTVSVEDADSSLTVDSDLEVGAAGQGLLLIDGDSTVSGDATIGSEDGGQGQVTVNIATLEIDGATIIGKAGSGAMLVQLGGTLTAHDVTLGDEAGGDGTLTLSGDGATATTDGLTVGGSGQGTLEVDDSAQLTSNADSTFGDTASANIQTGTIESDGNWTIAGGGLTVGDAGIADLTIKSGGAVSVSEDITLGDQGAATGEIDVSGVSTSAGATPSSLTFGGTLTVGGSGKGTLDIADGAQVSPNAGGKGEIDIAAESNSIGGVTVDGAGSELEGDALAVGGKATAEGGSGTLDISAGGVASTTDAIVWGGGKVTLAGGDLDASSITVSAGGAVSGYGDLSGTIASGSEGSVTASGGELLLSGAVDSVATSFLINGAIAGSDLAFSGKVESAPTITFEAGANWGMLDLTGEGSGSAFAQNFDGVISGFAGKGDAASTSDVIEVTAGSAGDKAVWRQTDPGVSGTLQIETSSGGALESLTLDGAYTNGQFGVSDLSDVDQITYAACYRRGTRILIDRGEVAIEALSVGDLAVTASGALRPIVWIGHRRIDISRHPNPAVVRPVRVSAGAFGGGLPCRDLWLSPGHNVCSEGALMPISALVNGLSVSQIDIESVEYWHVELDAHDILFAEGLPAESYLDAGNRTAFSNGGAFIEAHPDFQPKHWAETCLPLVMDGPCVARTKKRLLARLVERGYRVTRDSDAHVLVDGARVEPIALSATRLAFPLPAGGRDIVLCSNVFVPAQTSAESADPRVLGLCIGRLQVDGSAVALDSDEGCACGWREAERSEGRFLHRWTTGSTPLAAGARIVIVELAGVGHYWRGPEGDIAACA